MAAADRQLPEHRNPLIEEDRSPVYEILVERRCLGQTELKVKTGQVGTSSATKPDNLGVLDYAHLRVPLPKDLSSSGIFARGPNKKYPEAYFLMRRSSDGFISATGMFKAAFPYAQVEEEVAEKEYMKALHKASNEEIAGNVWIHPDQALLLADEYGLRTWLEALLDPEPITHGTNDPNKSISSPPPYHIKDFRNGSTRSPKSEKKSSRRARSTRSVSPTKKSISTPARKIATPKSRRGRGRGTTASVEPESVNGEAVTTTTTTTTERRETVKVEVENTISEENEEAVSKTKVNIELPSNHPDLKIPDDPKALMDEARKMVAEAEKLAATSSSKSKGKRKATELEVDLEEQHVASSSSSHQSKRVRTEVDRRRERLRRRTMVGIGATLAVGGLLPVISGVVIPMVFSAFGS